MVQRCCLDEVWMLETLSTCEPDIGIVLEKVGDALYQFDGD